MRRVLGDESNVPHVALRMLHSRWVVKSGWWVVGAGWCVGGCPWSPEDSHKAELNVVLRLTTAGHRKQLIEFKSRLGGQLKFWGGRVFHTIDVPGINNTGDTYPPYIPNAGDKKYRCFSVFGWISPFLACLLTANDGQEVGEQVLLASSRPAEDIKYAHTLHNLWHIRPNRKIEGREC